MYKMNDGFARSAAAELAASAKHMERKHPIMRSLSVDVIHTASHGNLVSNNWLEFEERFRFGNLR